MSTIAKNLKDTNGNIILPKTRSEQVYRPDNTSVETTISNIDVSLSSHDKKVIYDVIHTKTGTQHLITDIPDMTISPIIHLSFKASGDYITGDTIVIGDTTYTCKLMTQEDPPDAIFLTNSIVILHCDTVNHICFFDYRGTKGGEIIPPQPTSFTYLTAYGSATAATNVTWTVPESSWYRIFCVGQSAPGTRQTTTYTSFYGGNSGGIATSILYLEKDTRISITISWQNPASYDRYSNLPVSFGNYCSATSNGSAVGGNVDNEQGFPGGSSTNDTWNRDSETPSKAQDGYAGGNLGMSGGKGYQFTRSYRKQNFAGAGGSGGARLPARQCPYVVSSCRSYYGGNGGARACDGWKSSGSASNSLSVADPTNAMSYPAFFIGPTMKLYGGGGCGGSYGDRSTGPSNTYNNGFRAAPSDGTPGCIIIEKGIR